MEGYQQIELGRIVDSKTNPRREFNDENMRELVESVRQKGILNPVIVRETNDLGVYELVAGKRRLVAAGKAGLKTIAASVRSLTDSEAREVQIIENLQREDVHPMDEARAYKGLISTVKDIAAVAAKVGKSAAYVKARLSLVQLGKDAEKSYRLGILNDGHAVEVARLSPAGDQQKAVAWVKNRYAPPSVKDLKEWIDREFFTHLVRQPWLTDKSAAAVVGECRECPKNVDTLFGPAKAGACVSVKCWKRKMDAYLSWRLKQSPKSALIVLDWSNDKGVLAIGSYRQVGKKKCEYAATGIVASGPKVGTAVAICVETKCKVHNRGGYGRKVALTPAEKAREQKAQEDARKRKAAAEARERRVFEYAVARVSFPPSDATLGVMLECVMYHADLSEIAERRAFPGWEKDSEKAVRDGFAKLGKTEKFRFVVEALLDGVWSEDRKSLLKKL